MRIELYNEDCLTGMKRLESNSVDGAVTDPPYGLGFMGHDWDKNVPDIAIWEELYRILKPGATLLAMAGTRTYHRIASTIDDAGFYIHDMISWLYSQGFPKAYDIGANMKGSEWQGYKTCFKPAFEPICVAQKPREGTYVENAQKYGVAGYNIDECRVPTDDEVTINTFDDGAKPFGDGAGHEYTSRKESEGRYPANIIHDGSKEVVDLFPYSKSSKVQGVTRQPRNKDCVWDNENNGLQNGSTDVEGYDDEGSAARFFYCAKASRGERNEGLDDGFEAKDWNPELAPLPQRNNRPNYPNKNRHPTLKPITLMEYLVRLIKPPSDRPQGVPVIIDPFMGSGTTGIACVINDIGFIGFEREEEWFRVAKRRIEYWKNKPRQKELF